MKAVIVVLLLAVVISLGSALFSMKKDSRGSSNMLRALTIRVVLSIALIVTLIVSWKLGYLEPQSGG